MLATLDDQRLDRGRARVVGAGRACGGREALHVARRHDRVELPVGEQDRPGVVGDRLRRADVGDPMAARPDVDPGRQPCQRVGDHVRDRQVREAEGLAGEAVRIGRARGGDDGRDARIGGRREDRPDGAHRMARDRPPR